jgi:hypothetical protein
MQNNTVQKEIRRIIQNCISFKSDTDPLYEKQLEDESVEEVLAILTGQCSCCCHHNYCECETTDKCAHC